MKNFSDFTKQMPVTTPKRVVPPAPLKESVKTENNFHKNKAEFHRQAAQFFNEGGMKDRARFQSDMAAEHEKLGNV